MTEEKGSRPAARESNREGGSADSGRSRKGRRRYFQPKRDGRSQSSGNQAGNQGSGQSSGQGSGQAGAQQGGQSAGQSGRPSGQSPRGQDNRGRGDNKRGDGKRGDDGSRSKRRDARRRARSRQRYDDTRAANLEAEVAYTAPQSVYIYEHSAHPELRDSYEFRPDHFSKVGRTLDDYQIDLSKLFPGEIAEDGTPVFANMLPKPQFDWTGWEDNRPEANPPANSAVNPETDPGTHAETDDEMNAEARAETRQETREDEDQKG